MKRDRLRVTMLAVLSALVTSVTLAAPASAGTADVVAASVPTSYCNGKAESLVVKNYKRAADTIPLRCGTPTYGFVHLVTRGRWNAAFDSQIAQTIARGEVSADRTIYATFDARCHELFRVVVNPGPIGGNGFRPQGIITAYHISPIRPTAQVLAAPADGQCPIIEPIADPH
jgi:hypothetical protein